MAALKQKVIIIGYSGHAYVACDIFRAMGLPIAGYCDVDRKKVNPYDLKYLGREKDPAPLSLLKQHLCFIAIGDNHLRAGLFDFLESQSCRFVNAIDPSASVSPQAVIGRGVMIAPHAVINPLASVGDGAICNTASVVEHECLVGKFSHICPGAVLCGNVTVGEYTQIGANAVIKQNITVGEDVVVGAGTVVLRDIASKLTVAGNPQQTLSSPPPK